jgi:hypothetical protein
VLERERSRFNIRTRLSFVICFCAVFFERLTLSCREADEDINPLTVFVEERQTTHVGFIIAFLSEVVNV